MVTKLIRKPPWFKVWSAITAIALTIALLLTFLPYEASIDTGGFLSIGLGQKASAQEHQQSSIRPGFGWAPIHFSTYASGFTAGQIYNATFPSNINSGSGVSYSYANYTLTYHLSGGKIQWTDADGLKTKAIGAVLSSVGAIQPDGEHNKVAYANAFLNTTVEYRAYSVGVKEVFVLSELPYNDGKIADSYLEYTGELTWDSGLSVWVDGIEYPDKTFNTSSSVDFRDIATNETVFSFLAPIAWDSDDSRCTAVYDVKVSVDKVQYGLRVPYSWLQTATFPVTIDPSFTARTETYFDAASLSSPYDATHDKPEDTVEGDILFALVCWYAIGVAIDSVPTDWTLAGSYTATADHFALYYKVAGGSEPSSYTWSFDASCKVWIVCSCYTGGDFNTGDPIDVVSDTSYRTLNTIVRAAAMTVSATDSPLVFFGCAYSTSSRTFTKPTTPTDTWTEDDDAGSTTSDFWTEICSMIWSGSGDTTNIDATLSAGVTQKHAFAVALNPAAAPEPEITNTPDNYGFGILEIGTTVATTINYFTITNTGNCAVDVTVRGTDLTSPSNGNFTTYTEIDPNSKLTVNATRVTYAGLAQNETAYLYKDKGVGHFNGDFEHLVDVYLNASDDPCRAYVWGLANLVDDYRGIYNADGDGLFVNLYRGAGLNDLTLVEMVAGYPYTILWDQVAFNTTYYLTVSRNESIGTYGRLYLDIYSNAARTSWLETLYLNLHEKEDFRYIYALQSYNVGNAFAQSGYCENLDLQEEDYTWDLADDATPSENIYGLYAGLDDADDLFDVIVRESATYNTLVSNLAEDATQDWGLKIWMPTALSGYGNQQMTATITLVASESS